MMLKLQIKMSGCEAQMQPSQGIEVSRRYTYIGAWLKYAKILQEFECIMMIYNPLFTCVSESE